ncbi:MAG: DNA topoisomerase IB [Methylobacterium mesophilicum]|nr:DNA topoisomerase IB [Methylobacterium mesophilicum]
MLKKTEDPRDPKVAAKLASLVYLTDDRPGITRRKSGSGYSYFLPGGERLKDKSDIARIDALAIPPAYTDVWISPEADAHLQATGRDDRGRKQYRYHPRWAEARDESKYGSLITFATALPVLRAQVDMDLRRRGLGRERVIASVVWLLENTMIRVGNQAYARDNKSFGLTTLRDRHARMEGGKMRLKFKGKSGKEWDLNLTDRRIINIVRGAQDLPGQHLFQYLDEDGERRMVRSQDVNDYLRDIAGDFTAKHFRTWGGTQSAAALLRDEALPETKSMAAKRLNAIVDEVAHRLGNTRAVCRKAYIHPRVISHWSEGILSDGMVAARKSFRKPVEGLDEEETLLLRWLELSAASV